MKNHLKHFLLVLYIILSSAVFSNAQKKTEKTKTNPSSQELQQMMNEMQNQMENMDPESKEMMKKMGIGMPDMNKIGYAVSGDYKDTGPIPELNEARIQMAKQNKLNSGNLAGYIQKIHQAVCTKVGAEATGTGKEIFQMAKSKSGGAQAANGLWAFGANLPAVVVLGNTLIEDPKNTDDLNNYAAFLIMAGAEEGALPILEYLNKIYPKNSTILNNIGQAWFGLGELKMAENYLDSVIALYAGHSQANFTKSLIQEHKGEKNGAVSSMKRSIKTAYSSTKEERLKSLDYDVKENDISWHTSLPQDPLGFEQVSWPPYPRSVSESDTYEAEWEGFREEIRGKMAPIQSKFQQAQTEYTVSLTEDPFKMMKTVMNTNLKLPQSIMPFSSKARAKLEYYKDDDELELAKYERVLQDNDSLQAELRKLDEKHRKELQEIEKKLGKYIGEGETADQRKAYCEAIDKSNDKYLELINTILEKENKKWLEYWRKTMSRRLNYYQYSMPEEAFEMEKLKAQMMWLGLVSGQEVIFIGHSKLCNKPDKQKPALKHLGDFYDMTCKEKSVMNLGIGSVTIECNKMTTELDAGFVKYSQRENMDNGTIIRGTVEIGKDFGIGKGVAMGPVKAELKAGAGAFIEFDSEGITDVGVKGGISAEAGTNLVPEETSKETGIGDQGTTAFGAEARWGWNSGGSVAGKGLLSGLSIK